MGEIPETEQRRTLTPEERRKLVESPLPAIRVTVPNGHLGASRGPARILVKDFGLTQWVKED